MCFPEPGGATPHSPRVGWVPGAAPGPESVSTLCPFCAGRFLSPPTSHTCSVVCGHLLHGMGARLLVETVRLSSPVLAWFPAHPFSDGVLYLNIKCLFARTVAYQGVTMCF